MAKQMLARYPISNRLKPRTFLRRFYTTSNTGENPNKGIIDLLQHYKEAEENSPVKNPFKIVAFSKAIKAISNVEHPIRSGSAVMDLPGVGPRISARIDEYLCSDGDPDPELQLEAKKSRALSVLQGVPGIGIRKAKKLVEAGCMTLTDLRTDKYSSILTKAQSARLKYMGLEEGRTNPQEAEEILRFCCGILDSKYQPTLVGDYRRGAVSFPDIRMMISHPDYVDIPPPESPNKAVSKKRRRPSTSNLLHDDVVPLLQKKGLVAETVSINPISWQGIVRLPESSENSAERLAAIEEISGHYRIMHITFVPQESRGAGLLTLTGDSAFDKTMSSAAEKLNLHLDNHGLWSWQYDHYDDDNVTPEDAWKISDSPGHWRLVKSATENDIFEELGMDFIEPDKRNFLFVWKRTTSNPD